MGKNTASGCGEEKRRRRVGLEEEGWSPGTSKQGRRALEGAGWSTAMRQARWTSVAVAREHANRETEGNQKAKAARRAGELE